MTASPTAHRSVQLLALCGSLRRVSLNAMLLRATQRVAPESVRVLLYPSLGNLPFFNPDIEHTQPFAVKQFSDAISASDGLIIASPEYARGISGVMKNALDWMVGNEVFINKPIMLLNASPRAHHALDALQLTLRTMSANLIDDAYVAVQIMGTQLNEAGLVNDPHIAQSLQHALQIFAEAINVGRPPISPAFPIVPAP